MASSASDSRSRVPGFRDGWGNATRSRSDRAASWSISNSAKPLPLNRFSPRLSSRVWRGSRGSAHASYCRVRRVQHAAGGDGSIALVSTHVAGRRLAELLDVAARSDLKPTTGAVLAVTRQVMTAAALLHDFAPDGFHGALGPERVILPSDGRVVLAEHVLGTVVERAAEAWGPNRLWREFRLATLPVAGSAHDGRRADVLQISLVALSLCLGRPLEDGDYPDQVGWLLARATERQAGADGDAPPASVAHVVRAWPFASERPRLSDAARSQKALGQIAQEPEFAGVIRGVGRVRQPLRDGRREGAAGRQGSRAGRNGVERGDAPGQSRLSRTSPRPQASRTHRSSWQTRSAHGPSPCPPIVPRR